MKRTIQTLVLLSLTASLAQAQEPPQRQRPDREAVFRKLDADADGSISLDEFKAGPRAQKHPEMAERIFNRIDADGSGGISMEEFMAHKPPHRPGRPGKRDGGADE